MPCSTTSGLAMIGCCGQATANRYLSLTLGLRFGGSLPQNNYRVTPPETFASVYDRVLTYLGEYDMDSIPDHVLRQLWIGNPVSTEFVITDLVDSTPLPNFLGTRQTFNNFIQSLSAGSTWYVRIGVFRASISSGNAVAYSPGASSPLPGCQNYIGPVQLTGPVLAAPIAPDVLVSQPWSLASGADPGCPGP